MYIGYIDLYRGILVNYAHSVIDAVFFDSTTVSKRLFVILINGNFLGVFFESISNRYL